MILQNRIIQDYNEFDCYSQTQMILNLRDQQQLLEFDRLNKKKIKILKKYGDIYTLQKEVIREYEKLQTFIT